MILCDGRIITIIIAIVAGAARSSEVDDEEDATQLKLLMRPINNIQST